VLKVALIDDSLAIQRSLSRLLLAIDQVQIVGCAEDVKGAIALIDDTRPDVVVLDVDLRDDSRGMDVLLHVAATHPEIQVIALSNFTWQAMREGFLRAGASAYFDKGLEFTKARDWVAAQVRAA
jgi:DNA-binding NarL/FixJ family response regulator